MGPGSGFTLAHFRLLAPRKRQAQGLAPLGYLRLRRRHERLRAGARRSRPLHLAWGGRAGHIGLEVLQRDEGVAGFFRIDRELAAGLVPLRDEQPLLELVVGLAHLDLAVEAVEF